MEGPGRAPLDRRGGPCWAFLQERRLHGKTRNDSQHGPSSVALGLQSGNNASLLERTSKGLAPLSIKPLLKACAVTPGDRSDCGMNLLTLRLSQPVLECLSLTATQEYTLRSVISAQYKLERALYQTYLAPTSGRRKRYPPISSPPSQRVSIAFIGSKVAPAMHFFCAICFESLNQLSNHSTEHVSLLHALPPMGRFTQVQKVHV